MKIKVGSDIDTVLELEIEVDDNGIMDKCKDSYSILPIPPRMNIYLIFNFNIVNFLLKPMGVGRGCALRLVETFWLMETFH